MQDYRTTLESIGYKLLDFGDHWRTKALYREGGNAISVKIYKNTGVWSDFGAGDGCKPFNALVEATVKDKQKAKLLINQKTETFVYQPKEKIQMEKVYPESDLERLFPNYHYYQKKGISESTQRAFKVGLAGVGKMYRRLVFPIYNENKQIIGFSGRKVDDDNDYPKWKHLGRKSGWVYPAYVPDSECDEEIEAKREVILVESIGDAMALYENGIKNVLVIFGVSTNAKITSYLSSKELDRIIISTNNDLTSKNNNGLIGAIKNYLKLLDYFDPQILLIKMPPKKSNDFGEAHEKDYNMIEWLNKEINQEDQRKFMSSFVAKNASLFSASHIKKAKSL